MHQLTLLSSHWRRTAANPPVVPQKDQVKETAEVQPPKPPPRRCLNEAAHKLYR